ncbi:hypothetical protein GPB2148_1745 [marine gamma proteobacterium HTCC2148]|nr:hypothetical protein GPB2148_1745 [marine gamma proteobacterium HTCC2148]
MRVIASLKSDRNACVRVFVSGFTPELFFNKVNQAESFD